MKFKRFLWIFVCLIFTVTSAWSQVPSPEDYLGFPVGTEKKLADMNQIIEYFRILGENSSRVLIKDVGRTTMNNPFIVAIITSSDNHSNLGELRDIQQKLADPRQTSPREAEELFTKGKAVVMVNCSLHATEIGASQMSMQLAYDLAFGEDSETREILDNVILLLTPMHNPDGIKMVVDWYREHLGTQYEGGRMPWLYHKYVGHDNNRDWFMFTQKETQLTIDVHNDWHPHVIVDMHQMGSTGPRLFVPPFVDPYEPNIDPILRQEVAMMGTFMATQLTAEGKAGVMHSVAFDAWTPARAYHHYHGGIRILTEAASVKIATPIEVKPEDMREEMLQESVSMPLPWKGGAWTLKDIVDYDYSAARAALLNAARLRENWMRNYYQIFENEVSREKPFAYLVPADQRDKAAAIKMLQVLHTGDVEIHRAEAEFSAAGRNWPAGTYVVYMAQPFGGFAKTLLEPQEYPEFREYPGGPLKTPYDVVGHTLPYLMGVDAVKIEEPFRVKARLLPAVDKPAGSVRNPDASFGFAWSHSSNDDIAALNRLLGKGFDIGWAAERFTSGGRTFPCGTMIAEQKPGLRDELHETAQDLLVEFIGLETEPSCSQYRLKNTRLGVYQSWTASMDEGWTRFVLEQHEFPYQTLHNDDIRAGKLNSKVDVILLPSMNNQTIVDGLSEDRIPPQYAGGIGELGVKNIRDFIEKGGTLITLNSASDFVLQSLHVGVEDKTEGLDRKDFFIPGSLLKVLNDNTHPVAYGYGRDAAVFFRRSPVFEVHEGRSIVTYPPHALMSGWVNGEGHLTNRSALAEVPFGEGKVILIGFPAQYRSQAHGTFRYLFNAIHYGAAQRD